MAKEVHPSVVSERIVLNILGFGTRFQVPFFAILMVWMMPYQGTLAAELNNHGLHDSKRYSAAMYRDYVTPKNVNALETFGGTTNIGPTPKESGFLYPASTYARRS